VQEAARGSGGRLNVALTSWRFLPRCLRAFREDFPEVEIFLVEMDRVEQLAAMRDRRIHFGTAPDFRRFPLALKDARGFDVDLA
jgi:DNA-binding transcriptional LysR family regulator